MICLHCQLRLCVPSSCMSFALHYQGPVVTVDDLPLYCTGLDLRAALPCSCQALAILPLFSGLRSPESSLNNS